MEKQIEDMTIGELLKHTEAHIRAQARVLLTEVQEHRDHVERTAQ
jgi:hypothetical protein